MLSEHLPSQSLVRLICCVSWSSVLNHGLRSQLKELTASINKSGKSQGQSTDQTGVIVVGHIINFKLVPDIHHRYDSTLCH